MILKWSYYKEWFIHSLQKNVVSLFSILYFYELMQKAEIRNLLNQIFAAIKFNW